jgi:histidinol-phosphate aminotransferase
MLRPKPYIENLQLSIHGGLNFSELKRLAKSPAEILDFSVNTNPFGPPPGLAEALAEAPFDSYPDSDSSELRTILASNLKVSQENIIVTSGSTEAIRILAAAYFGPGDRILIPGPTYSEYETACQLAGANVIKPCAIEQNGFKFNVDEIIKLIRQHHPRGVFICNPNNPTGHYISKAEVRRLLSVEDDYLLILDEAYVNFVEDAWFSPNLINEGNLVILRSMTKDYAMAGLRLGYAVSESTVISVLNRVKPPWNLNIMAQKAGIYVFSQDNYLTNCRVRINEAGDFLKEGLSQQGFTLLPSRTNFFLVKVKDASSARRTLLHRGILIRDCSSFGLPDYIRISVRTIDQCRTLIDTIKECELVEK